MHASLPRLWTDVPLHAAAVARLSSEVHLIGPTAPGVSSATPDDFALADAAIVSPRVTYDAAAFARAPKLKAIARSGIGYDNVDVDAATSAGVCALNTPEAPTESTAEFAIALMFAVARRVATADHGAKAGEWKVQPPLMGFDLAGKTLALLGFGRIARRVAQMAKAVEMRVRAFDPFVPREVLIASGVAPAADLDDLLESAHVLSLHAPLGPETRNVIGADQLARLPKGAVLINTARGPLMDETAVLAALNLGHLFGAGIDVWNVEPTPADNPLYRHPLVVATPHIAAYTDEGRERSHVTAAEQILMVLRGERPTNLLNPSVWSLRRD